MAGKETNLTAEELRDYDRLVSKSQEAFILAIELFNRPTIQYRVEGCAFFLCNAWELMLKAYLIRRDGYQSIFYPGKTRRTLSLEDCLKKTMTNDKDPVRLNIESISELRNIGTHFIVEEYEITYGPIFQANIRNYDDKLRAYHGIEICDIIPDNYLTLSVNRTDIDGQTIRAKYTREVAERLLSAQTGIDQRAEEESNMKYAVYFRTEFTMSKKDGIPIKIDSESGTNVNIIKQVINPEGRYPYRTKDVIERVNRQLRRRNVKFTSKDTDDARFNKYHFGLFVKCYGMKQDERYSFDRSMSSENGHLYIYSESAINLIVEEIAKDPEHIITKLCKKTKRMEK